MSLAAPLVGLAFRALLAVLGVGGRSFSLLAASLLARDLLFR